MFDRTKAVEKAKEILKAAPNERIAITEFWEQMEAVGLKPDEVKFRGQIVVGAGLRREEGFYRFAKGGEKRWPKKQKPKANTKGTATTQEIEIIVGDGPVTIDSPGFKGTIAHVVKMKLTYVVGTVTVLLIIVSMFLTIR